MTVFQGAVKAVIASNEMQLARQRAGEEGKFATDPLRVKIGLHYGSGLEVKTGVFGKGLWSRPRWSTWLRWTRSLPPMARLTRSHRLYGLVLD